jgi:leucyl-tRNA synthetase
VKEGSDGGLCLHCDKPVQVGRIEKMSKSKKNVIDPNILLEAYGADTTRLFCLFASPPDKELVWSDRGVEGSFRFLNRVWRLARDIMDSVNEVSAYNGRLEDLTGSDRELFRKTHQAIKKVTNDIEDRYHFNTAISAVMELVNVMYRVQEENNYAGASEVMKLAMESVILLLAPIVPHFADEIWQAMGNRTSILCESWPKYWEDAMRADDLLIVVQVNGKLRGKFNINIDADDEVIKEKALDDPQVKKHIRNKPIRKVIVVKKKLVNIVT